MQYLIHIEYVMPNQNQFFQLLPFHNSEYPINIEQELRNIFFFLGVLLILINKTQTNSSIGADQLKKLTTTAVFLLFGVMMHGCSLMQDKTSLSLLYSH